MYPYPLTYHRPVDLSEAVALHESLDDPSYMSGGHTLIPAMKGRLAAPSDLIDLRAIPELHGITVENGCVVVGAATTHAQMAASRAVADTIPALAGLAGSIADAQVRHVGTVGGSVANNDPAADYPSAVLALDATVHTDRREIKAHEFFTGLYSTALEPGEIITRIAFHVPASAGYAKLRNPASRYALAAAFVAHDGAGDVRVAITGAGNDGVFRWADAEKALKGALDAAAIADLRPDPGAMMSDMHGSAEYRAHLVNVQTKRSVACLGRTEIV